jgi:hypothetical protein
MNARRAHFASEVDILGDLVPFPIHRISSRRGRFVLSATVSGMDKKWELCGKFGRHRENRILRLFGAPLIVLGLNILVCNGPVALPEIFSFHGRN